MRLVFLDSGPVGLLTNPRGRPKSDRCRQWVKDLATAGARIFVPEIADYEVRRNTHPYSGVCRYPAPRPGQGHARLRTDHNRRHDAGGRTLGCGAKCRVANGGP